MRRFLWSGVAEEFKDHFVSLKSNSSGDLEIENLRPKNISLLAK